MFRILSTSLFVLFVAGLQAQLDTVSWVTLELDSVMSFQFPSESEYMELDTTINGQATKGKMAFYDDLVLTVSSTRTLPEEQSLFSGEPHDMESLMKFYDDFLEGVRGEILADSVASKGLKKDGIHQREFELFSKNKEPLWAGRVFYLNEKTYSVGFFRTGFDGEFIEIGSKKQTAQTFLNSIALTGVDPVQQYTYRVNPTVLGEKTADLLVLGVIIAIVAIILRRRKTKPQL